MFSRLPECPVARWHAHSNTYLAHLTPCAKKKKNTPGDPEEITDKLKMGGREKEEEEGTSRGRRKAHLLLAFVQTVGRMEVGTGRAKEGPREGRDRRRSWEKNGEIVSH